MATLYLDVFKLDRRRYTNNTNSIFPIRSLQSSKIIACCSGQIASIVSFISSTSWPSAICNSAKTEFARTHCEAVGVYTFSALSTLVAPVVIVSFKHRSDSVLEEFRQTSRKSAAANYINW